MSLTAFQRERRDFLARVKEFGLDRKLAHYAITIARRLRTIYESGCDNVADVEHAELERMKKALAVAPGWSVAVGGQYDSDSTLLSLVSPAGFITKVPLPPAEEQSSTRAAFESAKEDMLQRWNSLHKSEGAGTLDAITLDAEARIENATGLKRALVVGRVLDRCREIGWPAEIVTSPEAVEFANLVFLAMAAESLGSDIAEEYRKRGQEIFNSLSNAAEEMNSSTNELKSEWFKTV